MAMTQQELKPQPRETPDDDLDEMYEEEPRRRAWGAIASVVLALALVFVGYQWNQAATRAEAETQRLRAEDAQRQVDVIQKRLAAVSAEKDSLAERIVSLEKTAASKSTVAKVEKQPEKPKTTTKATAAAPAPVRPKATPVATRNPTTKKTP